MNAQQIKRYMHCRAAFYETATFLVLRVRGSKMVRELVRSIEGARSLARAILYWTWNTDDFGVLLHVSFILILPFEDSIRGTSRPVAFSICRIASLELSFRGINRPTHRGTLGEFTLLIAGRTLVEVDWFSHRRRDVRIPHMGDCIVQFWEC